MANNECRIEDYILPECSADGKSISICFRIPPQLWHEVNRLVSTGTFPFESRQAMLRWAFNRGIRALAATRYIAPIPILELPFIAFHAKWPPADPTFFAKLHGIILQLRGLGYDQQRLLKFANAIEGLIECLPKIRQSISYSINAEKVWESTGIPVAEQKKARRGL